MKKLEITVKFTQEDTIYTTKKIKVENVCSICEGKKTITYNNKEMRCPECNGRGNLISNKFTNIVCNEPFVISATKIEVNSNGGTSVKYRGNCGISARLNRAEDNLFLTKEQAIKKCKELNKEKVFINISDINIEPCFRETQPSIEKVQSKLDYYKANSKFDKEIIIDRNNVLQDGYINYLICNLLNIEAIKAVIENKNTAA